MAGGLYAEGKKQRETLTPQPCLVPSLAEKAGLDVQKEAWQKEKTYVSRLHMMDESIGIRWRVACGERASVS